MMNDGNSDESPKRKRKRSTTDVTAANECAAINNAIPSRQQERFTKFLRTFTGKDTLAELFTEKQKGVLQHYFEKFLEDYIQSKPFCCSQDVHDKCKCYSLIY